MEWNGFSCWWVLVIWQKQHQSVDLNEYNNIQDGIIAIIVLIFYNPLNLLLSEDSYKEREFWKER